MSGTIDHVNLTVKLDSKLLNPLDLSSPDDALLYTLNALLSNGTGSSQGSQQWHDTRSLGISANENLDLAGSLVNAFGVTLTFTKLKIALFKAAPGNTNNVNVIRAASNGVPLFNAASGGVSLNPGAWMLYFDPVGITVTAATGDLFNVANSGAGTSVTYDVIFIGVD